MNDMQKFLKKARQVCLKRNPMTMEEIDCIIHEDSSERLTRQQMMEKYPNRWIGINNIEYEDLERKIIKAADVVYTNKTASELGLISLKEKIVIPFYTTPDDTYQMGALSTEDQILEVIEAAKDQIVFDEDCPEVTPEQAIRFHRVNPVRKTVEF